MPQDTLQIALEHHRAGRLRQAEAGYRELLRQDANHADALHWLGVLLHQAGLSEQAVASLERAAALRPRDAAFQHNHGQAYFGAGRPGEAVAPLERAAALEPGRAETLVALGLAHLSRRPDPNPAAAVSALRRAREAGLDTASLHHDLGVAELAAGKADDAIASLRAAVAKDPSCASAHHHLALAYRATGEPKEVRKSLIKALEIDPDRARAWYALGVLDAEAGNPAQAAGSFRKAVRVSPGYAAAYEALGDALKKAGREGEARQAFRMGGRVASGQFMPGAAEASNERAATQPGSVAEYEQRITPQGSVEQLRYALSALTGLLAPTRLPSEQVSRLFDDYADRFDTHLQEKLGYRVPERLAEAVAEARQGDGRLMDVFDLGCGTGLCGPLLRPMAATLRGVDLSPAMVEKARARGVYDALELGDLVDALKTHSRAFDLLTAADVLIYVGDLAPVMEAAAAALRPGGLFVFSVEAAGGDRFHLQHAVRRYAHSKPYVEHIAAICGFQQRSIEPLLVRLERGQPVPGYMVVLGLP
jgi:predicted TPR repeat methyltransferase/Tfp pilus assembly protein PilF